MKSSDLLPLYLRRELSTDDYLLRLSAAQRARKLDVVAYSDPECTKPKARWSWHMTASKPRKGHKTVTVNCYKWAAIWVA